MDKLLDFSTPIAECIVNVSAKSKICLVRLQYADILFSGSQFVKGDLVVGVAVMYSLRNMNMKIMTK
jgi:hypothetical protein